MEPRQENPKTLDQEPRAVKKQPRFRLIKLEERIAPTAPATISGYCTQFACSGGCHPR